MSEDLMIDKKIIQEMAQRLIKTYDPLEIYLFGSYAWGQPTQESDVDWLVIVEDSDLKKYKRSREGYGAMVGLKTPTDIIVYTKEEFQCRVNDVTTLCYKIKKEVKRWYEKSSGLINQGEA